MADSDLGYFLRKHLELAQEAQKRLQALQEDKLESVLTPKHLIGAKETELAYARERLDVESKARKAPNARYDRLLEKRRQHVKRLEEEISELRKLVDEGDA